MSPTVLQTQAVPMHTTTPREPAQATFTGAEARAWMHLLTGADPGPAGPAFCRIRTWYGDRAVDWDLLPDGLFHLVLDRIAIPIDTTAERVSAHG